MYLKQQLERYAEVNIPNLLQRQAFKSMIDEIPFDTRGLCLGESVAQYTAHPQIGMLIQDFQNRHYEFLTSEDFALLTRGQEN